MNECDVIYFFQQLSNRTVRSVEEKKRKTVLSDSRTAAITLCFNVCAEPKN